MGRFWLLTSWRSRCRVAELDTALKSELKRLPLVMDIDQSAKPVSSLPQAEEFSSHYHLVRSEFESLRAQRAAAEFQSNRPKLRDLLSEVLPYAVSEVLVEENPSQGADRNEVPERTRSSKRIRSRVSLEKLSEGIIVGVRLNVKTSNPPCFRKSYELPKATTIPPYTSWNFISENHQQQKVSNQKRLFYTDDDTGETLPASDEEKEMQEASYHRWDERDVEWRAHCLEAMDDRFGQLPNFSQLLSQHLSVDPSTIEQQRRKKEEKETAQDTTFQLCRRCLRYNCSLHPHPGALPARPTTPPIPDTAATSCSSDCWLLAVSKTKRRSGNDEIRSLDDDEKWTLDDVQLLEKGMDIYGDRSCALRQYVFTKTCAEIHRYLVKNPESCSRLLTPSSRRNRRTKKIVISNKKGALVVAKRLRHRESELWHQYLPCSCKSNCSPSCPCVKSKNFCDKYCSCWNGAKMTRKACSNAWKGCRCAQRCESQRCPCVAASRECDPDLCTVCRSEDHLPCRNMSIRKRKQKRVAMGLSEIDGWGTFMLENVKKDDLIGEYTGELITDEEAERRGRIYDIEDKSYLFSATTETVIDANHRGNKLRFANHSSEPNCYVKYLLVDGDYRVGIFAGRDVYAGEELLYDYGNSFQSNWNAPWTDQGSVAPTDEHS